MQYGTMEAEANDFSNKEQFPIRTILFDLDGTLIDHFSAIHRAIAHAQKELGLPECSYETVRGAVGGSTPITLRKLCGTEEMAEAAEPHFRKHFVEIMLQDVAPLPGAYEILARLKKKGYQLAVLTNKYDGHSKSVLYHLALDTHLDAIFGTGDGQAYRKPDPRFTMQALEKLDCSSEETVLVGDSPYDYQTAEAACLRCFLVTTGSHSADELAEQTSADGIFSDLYELGRKVFGLEFEQGTKPA